MTTESWTPWNQHGDLIAPPPPIGDTSPPPSTMPMAPPPPSTFDRAMAAPCGPVQPKRRDVKTFIATEAQRVVTGARREAYGKPEANFERIAKFWQAYFENTGRGAVAITAQDVSPLMRLMKEARLCESPGHLDSFVDIIGYAMTGAEVNGVDAPPAG